jgi:hypothetical protein
LEIQRLKLHRNCARTSLSTHRQLFTAEFLNMIADAGVESVKLPPRAPNLNAYAERFVRSIKESCLNRMILFGEESLRTAIQTSSLIITASEIIKA